MKDTDIINGYILDENTNINEILDDCNIPEQFVVELLEYGLITTKANDITTVTFDEKIITKVQKAYRFKQDLEINISGIAVILDLLDEVEQMREDLAILKRNIKLP